MKKDSGESPRQFLLHTHHNHPLRLWDKKIRAGYIYQVMDHDLRSRVLEMVSSKSSGTYITCPADPKKVLAIKAPFLHVTVKNLQRSLLIGVLVKDNRNVKRRFKAKTKQEETQVKPFVCKMPLTLESGWNEVVLPLHEYTRKAFGTTYVETLRVQIHATCRLQGVYFSHEPDPEDESCGGTGGRRAEGRPLPTRPPRGSPPGPTDGTLPFGSRGV